VKGLDVTSPTKVQDDDVSTSGSDDDDEAMEASGMDAKIAAVLRATADAKESSRKAKEAMSQLRFRVGHLRLDSAHGLAHTLCNGSAFVVFTILYDKAARACIYGTQCVEHMQSRKFAATLAFEILRKLHLLALNCIDNTYKNLRLLDNK